MSLTKATITKKIPSLKTNKNIIIEKKDLNIAPLTLKFLSIKAKFQTNLP
jgi:hypothetical protein